MIFKSISEKDTFTYGATCAQELIAHPVVRERATLITLKGNLGAGKTVFVKGFVKGCGINHSVTSPTFVLMKHYVIPKKISPYYRDLFHIDAYRLRTKKDAESIGLFEMLNNPHALILIEWPERLSALIKESLIRITIAHGKKSTNNQTTRTITFSS